MGKTKFQSSCIICYPWVKPSKNLKTVPTVQCACPRSMFLLVLHSFSYTKKQKKHKDAVNDSSRQSNFVFNKDGKITLTGDGKSKALSTEVQVAKTEIIQCIAFIYYYIN